MPKPIINSVNRNWHKVLGHPGKTVQKMALENAGINNYKPPSDCEICTKSKITVSKGHGSLRSATKFAEAIHMDLVGGQKSLSPVATDTSVPNAT